MKTDHQSKVTKLNDEHEQKITKKEQDHAKAIDDLHKER